MYSFDQRMASVVNDTNKKGWFVAILELGAWFGVLCTGYLADKLSRKYTIVLGTCVFSVFPLCGGHFREGQSAYFDFEPLIALHDYGGVATVIFCIGVIVQTAAFQPDSIFAGERIHSLASNRGI